MELTVDSAPSRVVLGAAGLNALAQEIRMVLATRRGSVPLDRNFGLDWNPVDMPLSAAGLRLVADVARTVEKYVPRVRVLEVRFQVPDSPSDAADGRLAPVVRVAVREEYAHEFK